MKIFEFYRSLKNFVFIKKFPFWAYNFTFNKKFIDMYYLTWYNIIPEGWRNAFGKQMSKEIKKEGRKYLKNYSWNEIFYIKNILFKRARLIIDCEALPSIKKIIKKYETLSAEYCHVCGSKKESKKAIGCNRCYKKYLYLRNKEGDSSENRDNKH